MTISYHDQSDYKLRYPKSDNRGAIITIARKFVAYEQNYPPGQQTLYTPLMMALLAEIDACEQQIADAKTRHAVAAEAVNRFDEQSKTMVSYMIKSIDAAYPATPAKATEWGFTVKQRTKNIMTPQSRDERLLVMKSYIAQEHNRPEAEQFNSPNLTEVIDVWQGLLDSVRARDEGQNDREAAIAACRTKTELLLKHIQAAAVNILSLRYNYRLSPVLQNWGYDVVRKRSESTGSSDIANSEEPAANSRRPDSSVEIDPDFDQTE